MARAPVSKTGGWGFEPLHSCQFQGQVRNGRSAAVIYGDSPSDD